MLPFDFSRTLSSFNNRVAIELYDQERSFANGVTVKGELVPRTDESGNNKIFFGIVLALSLQELHFYKEGSLSLGGIALLTAEQLFYTDMNESGQLTKQTFIKYQDQLYRVVGRALMQNGIGGSGNVKNEIYHALRSVE